MLDRSPITLRDQETARSVGIARPILSIGVTGHRAARLADADEAALAATVAATLERIELAAIAVAADVELRAITALADGADSIVAEAAIRRGWSLASILPFARGHYAEDFASPQSLATYDRLIAASGRVFELAAQESFQDDGDAPAAYERAGRIVLGQADILIAVWDGGPAQGRGGTGQIVAEAVARDIPVIQIDPLVHIAPALLWDGLTEHDLGQQTVDTVPRAALDALPGDALAGLIRQLLLPPGDAASRTMLAQLATAKPRRAALAVAYPLLLAVTGIQRPKLSHFQPPDTTYSAMALRACFAPAAARTGRFGARLAEILLPRFVQADMIASQTARLFRSSYVANFMLSALAVILTLLSLALPISFKPLLVLLELLTIATILGLTRTGRRGGWHNRWLDNRNLAEGLRCLAVSSQMGARGPVRSDPGASPDWVRYALRQTAQELGLPDAVVDQAYLTDVRSGVVQLIDAQIAYLAHEAHQMHLLEHRLHRLGTALFAATALACIGAMAFEAWLTLTHRELSPATMHVFLVGLTMVTAGLPALGAAIYGIRMQGEFASVAERAADSHQHLEVLRATIAGDALTFDTLQRRIAHLTALLTSDISIWRRTYHARPLALPG